MRTSRYKKGFTLIEVILAMAILGIIVIAFLNMFTFSMISVYRAGDKSYSTALAQDDLETGFAQGGTNSADQMTLRFGSDDIAIIGKNIDIDKAEGLSESSLSGFIPRLPTITLDLVLSAEGHIRPLTINVIGQNTHFNSTSRVEVWDHSYTKQIYYGNFNVSSNPALSQTQGSFTIPTGNNWLNYYRDHIVTIRTTVTTTVGGTTVTRTEIVKAKHTVTMPKLVAVGNGAIYVSDDGEYWFERSALTAPTYPTFPAVTQFNGVSYHDGVYSVVGNGGSVLDYRNNENWRDGTSNVTENITNVHNATNQFFATTATGKILQSVDGHNWGSMYNNNAYSFYDISNTRDNTVVVAVGNVVLSRGSGGWSAPAITPAANMLNAVSTNSIFDDINESWSYTFIAVGANGYMLRSEPNGSGGYNWIQIDLTSASVGTSDLYDVALYKGNWVAVGSNGLIITSQTGASGTWSRVTSGTTNHLRSVFGSNNRFFVVGDSGTILRTGENNLLFENRSIIGGENLMSIYGR